MRRFLTVATLAAGMAFGGAWWGLSLPARTAALWAAGSAVAAPAAFVVTRRIVCGNGTTLLIDDTDGGRGRIKFVKPDGSVYGPYDRT